MKTQLHIAFSLGAALLMAFVVSACKNHPAPSHAAELAGTYSLVSVNGNPLPARVSHDGAVLLVRAGTFTIDTNGTCQTKTVFVPPTGTEVTREVSATYTRDGAKLTMKWKGAGQTVATIEGDTLTMNNEGMVFVYSKQ